MNRNITTTYCRKQSVSLSATKDEYIVAEKKTSKDSLSNEEYDLEELCQWRWILYSYPFHHWIRRDALVGHTDTCDMWCKNTCSVFLIMSKIGTGPQNQTMKLNTLVETPIIQEDRDQDGVYQTNKR